MADIDVEQKSSGQSSWIWIAVAVIAVAGLMFWLASQDVESGPVVMEETTEDTAAVAADDAAAGEQVELEAVAGAPADYMGRTLAITTDVAATLGPRAYWAEIPGQNPFLVVVEEDAGDPGIIATGNEVPVSGTVAEVTEELVDGWIAEGAVNEGAREEATFATHYLQVSRIR